MTVIGEIESRDGKVQLSFAGKTLVAEAIRQAGLFLNTRCAGKGSCGGCEVELHEGTFQQDGKIFTVSPKYSRRQLGCKTWILEGPFRISVPRRSMVETGEQVAVDFAVHRPHAFNPSIRRLSVTIPSPTLGQTCSDCEALIASLAEQYQLDVTIDYPDIISQLASAIRQGDNRVAVYLARIDDRWTLLSVEPDSEQVLHRTYYGLAVDIGTTTVVVSLIDLADGKIVDSASCYNQQIRIADDIASRIVAAGNPQELANLQRLIIHETLNPLIKILCRKHAIAPNRLMRVAVSGNTVMAHLFLGVDPTSIGVVPFQPVFRQVSAFRARDLGLAIYPDAPVDLVPAISGYVGGDIVSDIHVANLKHAPPPALLLDIGTNGEIAVTDGNKLFVTACAAGPAFEGLRISHGLRAATGAIERIEIADRGNQCRYHAIADAPPIGICGSALIDFLAEAFKNKLINHAGRFDRSLLDRCPRLRPVEGQPTMLEYIIAHRQEVEDGKFDITVTEKDIETLLQAKAAIFAAMIILLRRIGKSTDDLKRVFLAGGFAKFLDVQNAIIIGLLPEIDLDRYTVIGNGSLAGAWLGLTDQASWNAYEESVKSPEVIELNLDPDFQEEFTFALFLPNLQTERFQNTLERIDAITDQGI